MANADMLAAIAPAVPVFEGTLAKPIAKVPIRTLQVNLGKRCNLACVHCHVEAGPQRTEELSDAVLADLLTLIDRAPQLETVDLTGGAPEMNHGFRPLVAAARSRGCEVIVRSNLTIYFEPGYGDLPDFFAANGVRIVASLPCYLQDNVDKMRGSGTFDRSIEALQWLNRLGYGRDRALPLDLVYNSPLPTSADRFSLPPEQTNLEAAYKQHLRAHFDIEFDRLLALANLPVGRTRHFLERQHLYTPYLNFLATHFNGDTVDRLMCRDQLSVDYLGKIYDCDFNQMEGIAAQTADGTPVTVATLVAALATTGHLNAIARVQTANHCYGCTAGSGSSCGGSLS